MTTALMSQLSQEERCCLGAHIKQPDGSLNAFLSLVEKVPVSYGIEFVISCLRSKPPIDQEEEMKPVRIVDSTVQQTFLVSSEMRWL